MAQQGKAGEALSLSGLASFVGAFFATCGLVLLAPQLVKIAFLFGPAEYFVLFTVALATLGGISSTNQAKSAFAAALVRFPPSFTVVLARPTGRLGSAIPCYPVYFSADRGAIAAVSRLSISCLGASPTPATQCTSHSAVRRRPRNPHSNGRGRKLSAIGLRRFWGADFAGIYRSPLRLCSTSSLPISAATSSSLGRIAASKSSRLRTSRRLGMARAARARFSCINGTA